MRRQIGLILIGSAALILLVPIKDILILLLHRDPQQAVLYIHIANLILVVLVTFFLSARFRLRVIPALLVGHIYALIGLVYFEFSSVVSLFQRYPDRFLLLLLLYPWQSSLSGLVGGILGSIFGGVGRRVSSLLFKKS